MEAAWLTNVEGAETIVKEWSRNDAEAAATRRVKAAARGDPTASTVGYIPLNKGARVTAPIEPPTQAELMARYMLEEQGGMWTFLYLQYSAVVIFSFFFSTPLLPFFLSAPLPTLSCVLLIFV